LKFGVLIDATSAFVTSYNRIEKCLTIHSLAPSDADFDRAVAPNNNMVVDANRYNIGIEEAAKLWTVSTQVEKSAIREAGVPFMDTKSKNHFVDDLKLTLSRKGGLGMELLELAGGRDDGLGITIISNVFEDGNSAKAGIIAGDSISAISAVTADFTNENNQVTEKTEIRGCECCDFDSTIGVLGSLDADIVTLDVKRIRRWPKVQVKVEYPKSQCAEGVSNIKNIELFAGENLKRGLLNRGIIMDDPEAAKCDFCGGTCNVSITLGSNLLNPKGVTEEKYMKKNPRCRISCKTVVGHNMQEGDLHVRVNLMQW